MHMKQYKIISSVCGIGAALCIVILPLLGGGWESLTGLELLQLKQLFMPDEIKACIVLAILCGASLAFLRDTAAIVMGSVGFVCVFASYSLSHSAHSIVEMRAGAYLALLGFGGAVLVNGLALSRKM